MPSEGIGRRLLDKMLLALSKIAAKVSFVTVRGSPFLRSTIVALTISAWLLAGNHCALAGENEQEGGSSHVVATGFGRAHSSIPAPDSDGDESEMACCSSLQAAVAQPAKNLVDFDQLSFVSVAYFLLPSVLFERQAVAVIPAELNTGPPYSFAENVIQRCLPSNAPPWLS